MIRVGPLGGAPPGAWNLVRTEGRAFVATDASVTAYDAAEGAVARSASAGVSDQAVWITKAGGSLVDLRPMGVSFLALPDLSPAAEPVPRSK